MFDRLDLKEQIGGQMVYNGAGKIITPLPFSAYYDIELIRKGRPIHRERIKNGITNDGKNNLLNRFFNGSGTNSSNWSIGLIDNTSFSTVSVTDTITSHAGWIEFLTYSLTSGGSTVERGSWGKATATGQQLTNAVATGFTFTAVGTLYGMFLISDNTKSGTIGTLWGTGGFTSVLSVLVDDILNVTYTLQL